jgi:hypothetical protein
VLGEAGRQAVRSTFLMPAVVDRLLALYEEGTVGSD